MPFLSKLHEKAVITQINEYLKTNNLLEKYQSGFRKYHSVETALLKVTNDIFIAQEYNQVTIICLIDLSAAFDTLDHDILISILKHIFGFDGMVLEWFKSYLCNRTQIVKIMSIVIKQL